MGISHERLLREKVPLSIELAFNDPAKTDDELLLMP